MIIIECPYCRESRVEDELRYGGEANIQRAIDPTTVSDEVWTDYLFIRTNPKGWRDEQWCCEAGCGQWFKVRRHSVSHAIENVVRFDVMLWPEKEPCP